jgi:hypothetical protein
VDRLWFVPTEVPHAPLRLWEPGDGPGTAVEPLSRADDRSSTIHSPYYYLWLFIYLRRQRK